MSPRNPVRAAALAALLLSPGIAAAAIPASLTFCVALGNPPLSPAGSGPGIEAEYARELARRLGAEPGVVWLDPHDESLEQAVLDGRCDAAMGALAEPDPMAAGGRASPGVGLTRPYYRTGYALLRRADARPARDLAELGRARIVVEKMSIPVFTLRQRGHEVHVVDDSEAVVATLARNRAAYGYLWAPMAAWLLGDRRDVILADEFVPADAWDFAVALRAGDAELRAALDAAVGRSIDDGTVAGMFARHGVPYRRPAPGRPLPTEAASRPE